MQVGLPARGKSYIVKKICRYLTWLVRRLLNVQGPLFFTTRSHDSSRMHKTHVAMGCTVQLVVMTHRTCTKHMLLWDAQGFETKVFSLGQARRQHPGFSYQNHEFFSGVDTAARAMREHIAFGGASRVRP